MGVFANMYRKNKARIPEDKIKEFEERVEKLYQEAGMMEFGYFKLCGKAINTIHKATMHDYGMDFFYNYYEDASWENAGYNAKTHQVWSNKIGGRQFCRGVVAACILEELYLSDDAFVSIEGEFVNRDLFIGWINFVFNERYSVKHRSLWGMFEAARDEADYVREELTEELSWRDWWKGVEDAQDQTEYCEIQSVLKGTEAALEYIEVVADGKSTLVEGWNTRLYESLRRFRNSIRVYCEKHKEEQFTRIIKHLKEFYEREEKDSIDFEDDEEQMIEFICHITYLLDAPAFTVKVLAEIYEKDFWELWDQLDGVTKRVDSAFLCEGDEVPSKRSTRIMMGVTADDMIIDWKGDGKIQFSQNLNEWFVNLRNRFEQLSVENYEKQDAMKWIVELMEYANENYYRIYTFTHFFEETLNHLQDSRYLLLWKIYEEILYDPEMEEAGSVIFVPDGPEYENEGVHYLGKQPRRRLWSNWDWMLAEKRNNKARVTLKRYMALVANKKLREKVFGF